MTSIGFKINMGYCNSMAGKEKYWYQKKRLKHVTGFLTKKDKELLQQIAKRRSDLTLTRYVTRLLEKHIEEYLKSSENETT